MFHSNRQGFHFDPQDILRVFNTLELAVLQYIRIRLHGVADGVDWDDTHSG